MDPTFLAQLMGMFNPVSSAMAAAPGAGLQGSYAEPGVVASPLDYPQPGPLLPPPAPAPAPAPALAPAVAAPAPTTVSTPLPPSLNPRAPSQEAYRSEPAPTVGSVLEPRPPAAPLDIRPPAQQASVAAAQAPAANTGDKLLKTLQGVQMPKPPEAQKVSTPHAPALRPIQGGGLAELMASLGVGPQQAFPGLKLPSTLGQALGGGRG